jgi:hypothetical protein
MFEDSGRDSEVAFARELVRDRADVRVDAKDLLDDDDAAARLPRGIGAPGSNRACPFRLQFNPGAHVDLLGFQRHSALMAA